MKKLSLLTCIFMLILILTGCKKELSKEELTLNYLNETYANEHDTFTFINCGYDLFPGSNDRCYFKSQKYDDEITVYLSKQDGKYYVTEDNYYHLFIYDDVQSFLDNIIKQYSKTNIKFSFISPYGSYKSFDDFLTSSHAYLDVYFISNVSFTESNIQSILNELANKKISGLFNFIKTYDQNLLSNYDLDYILNNQGELIETKETYSIDSTYFKIEKK